MKEYKDKAGNRIIKNLDGTYSGINAKGETVDMSSFRTLAKRTGFKANLREQKKISWL